MVTGRPRTGRSRTAWGRERALGGRSWITIPHRNCRRAVEALVELQRRGGGHALIGRELYPRFVAASLSQVSVSPRFVCADAGRPGMVEGFTRRTFAAMVEGVTDEAMRAGLMSREDWDRGVQALYRCAEPDGVFCYTFFKATGRR